MITKNELADKLNLSGLTVRNRAKALNLEEKYETENGTNIRVFTDQEADMIENYRGKKPGRKRND